MRPVEIIELIQQQVAEDERSMVLTRLRQDALIWSSLQDENILEKIWSHSQLRGEFSLSEWSPAQLVFSILDIPTDPEENSQKGLMLIDESVLRRALYVYEEWAKTPAIPGTLEEAGLLAIALREKRRLKMDWDQLFEVIAAKIPSNLDAAKVLRSPLTILYGFVVDPSELLQALVRQRTILPYFELVSHILLSNPIPVELLIQEFSGILGSLSFQQQLVHLRELNLIGQNELAIKLAEGVLKTRTFQEASSGKQNKTLGNPEGFLYHAIEMQQAANIHRLAGNYSQAAEYLQNSKDSLTTLLGRLEIQLAEVDLLMGNEEIACSEVDQVLRLGENYPELNMELGLILNHSDRAKSLIKQIPSEAAHPYIQIKQAALLAGETDLEAKRERARIAVNQLVQYVSSDQKSIVFQTAYDWQPISVLDALVELELPQEAIQCALIILNDRPADVEILFQLSKILTQLGDTDEALRYAMMAVMLKPNNLIFLRHLASLHEIASSWSDAMNVWELIVSRQNGVLPEDWCGAARCALALGLYQRAIETCEVLLGMDKNHEQAVLYLGKALIGLERYEEAASYLSKATLVYPQDAKNWLALADCYQKSGKNQRALEALRTAVLSVPESAEVNFALAEAYFSSGSMAEAVPFLRRAASLKPQHLESALRLGQTLAAIGQPREAAQVLSEARKLWPADAELGYELGRIYLSLGEVEAAIAPLETALQVDQPSFERLMTYARTLLGGKSVFLTTEPPLDFARLINAQQALEKALVMNPENFEGRLLMAEVLAVKGILDKSFTVYCRLVEEPEAKLNEWNWRVQGGMGAVALMLEQTETALASLQDAVLLNPNLVVLRRKLAEAYLSVLLKKEALREARRALALAPDDISNLHWFADMAVKLNEDPEAIHALQCATQLEPDVPDFWLKLADLQLHAGDTTAGQKTLAKMLAVSHVNATHLFEAASIFIRFNDLESAFDCMQRAVQISDHKTEVYFNLACLDIQREKLEDSLSWLEKALDLESEDFSLCILQSDLLSILNRPQAALACLEHASQIEWEPEHTALVVERAMPLVNQIMPEDWLNSLRTPLHLDVRMARLLAQVGDFPSAMEHILFALERSPEDLMLQYMAADYSLGLLRRDDALALLQMRNNVTSEAFQFDPAAHADRHYGEWISLQCLRVEMAFEMGWDTLAGELLNNSLDVAVEHPRVLALQARLLARQGQQVGARQAFQSAQKAYLEGAAKGSRVWKMEDGFINFADLGGMDHSYWLVLAAMELKQWDDAFEMAEFLAKENPDEPRIQLLVASVLVRRAEQQRICQELMSTIHAPGVEALSAAARQRSELALQAAEKHGMMPEIVRWRSRADAVFAPSPQAARNLVPVSRNSEDTAALIMALRMVENRMAAIQVGQKNDQAPEVALQLAITLLPVEPERAVEYAKMCVNKLPGEPLSHVILALAAQRTNDLKNALKAVEAALAIYPDESAWHIWAANLAEKLIQNSVRIDHLEHAALLTPESVEVMLQLADAYLKAGFENRSVDILNRIIRMEPDDPRGWMLLGNASLQTGNLKEAMQFAERACILSPNEAAPFNLCGRVMMGMRNYERAHHFALQGLERDPNDIASLLLQAETLTALEKPRDAIRGLEMAIAVVEKPLPLMMARAELVLKVDGPQAALPFAGEIVYGNPAYADGLVLLAGIQNRLGLTEESEKTAMTALRLDAENPRLNLLVGQLQRQRGQLDQALYHFSEAARLAPDFMDAYLEMGKTYQDRREYLQAVKIYAQAIKLCPKDSRSYLAAAQVYREMKDYINAETMLRKAAQIAPDDLNIRRQLSAVIALNLVHNSREANVTL